MNLLDEFAAEFDKPAAPKRTVRMIDAYEVYRKEHPGDYPSNYVTYLQFAEMCISATTGPLAEVIIPIDDGLTNSQRYIRDRDAAITKRYVNPQECLLPKEKSASCDFDIEPGTDDTGQVDLFALPATPAKEDIIQFKPKVGDKFKSSNEDDGYFEVISVKPTDNKPKPKESGVIANAFKSITTPMLDKALDQAEPKVSLFNVTGEPTDFNIDHSATQIETTKPSKLKASKIVEHGITFDSKLENYFYNLLRDRGVKFRFQVEYILQESFRYRHESILPVKIIIDFVLDDFSVIVDTKGWQMTDNKIKHKMLKRHLHELGTEMRIEMPGSQRACRELLNMLYNGFTIDEPLKEGAANTRKAKMKKAGFIWAESFWIKDEAEYPASFVMNLPKFEFEELLIKHT